MFRAGIEALLAASGASVRSSLTESDFERSGVRVLIDNGQRGGREFVAHDLAHSVVIGACYNRTLVAQDEIRRIGGYLTPTERPTRLTEAVWDVARGGGGWLSPSIFAESVPLLTDRQTEVLRLLAEGLDYREVAEALFISTNTVRSHARRIYLLSETQNGAGAVAWGFRNGLIR